MNSILQNKKTFHILLIESIDKDIFFMELALIKLDFEYTLKIVEDGDKAINYLKDKENFEYPDLIFLDLKLPGKDGIEVLKELKLDNELRSIPVIILASSYNKEDISIVYNNYAASYIVKPEYFDKFSLIIKQVKNYWFDMVSLPNYNYKVINNH